VRKFLKKYLCLELNKIEKTNEGLIEKEEEETHKEKSHMTLTASTI